MTLNVFRIFCLFIVLCCATTTAAAVGPYILTNLGDLPGNPDRSQSFDINSYGQVIGDSDVNGGPPAAFLWTPNVPNGTNGPMVELQELPGTPVQGVAIAINSYGQVIGRSGIVPALWMPSMANDATATCVIPSGLPAGPPPEIYSINAMGQIVGIAQRPGTSGPRPFLWTPTVPNGTTGNSVDIGEPADGGFFSRPADINAMGQVTLNRQTPTGGRAFLWTPTTANGAIGSMIDLGDLPGGSNSSSAGPINSYGQVLGVSGATDGTHAFLWTPTTPNGTIGSMIDLGNLPGGTGEVRVTAINSLGQVLGLATGNRAFLWTPSAPNGTSGTMVEVQSLLSPTDSAHWNVLVARGINDRGQIAGTGLFDPDGPGSQTAITMAFLLNPVPEPGTFALIVPIAWSARRIARHKCAA